MFSEVSDGLSMGGGGGMSSLGPASGGGGGTSCSCPQDGTMSRPSWLGAGEEAGE